MIVNGYCKEVFNHLPMEFAVEAQKLLGVSLRGKRRRLRPARLRPPAMRQRKLSSQLNRTIQHA